MPTVQTSLISAQLSGVSGSSLLSAGWATPPPSLSPSNNTVFAASTGNMVTISLVGGAQGYYTLDGTSASLSSTPYAAPFALPSMTEGSASATVVRAIAKLSGYLQSVQVAASYVYSPITQMPAITSASYVESVPPATMSSVYGIFTSSITVQIVPALSGDLIYYTTSSANPTTASTPYTGPFTLVSGNMNQANGYFDIRAIAVRPGWRTSSVTQSRWAPLTKLHVKDPAQGGTAGTILLSGYQKSWATFGNSIITYLDYTAITWSALTGSGTVVNVATDSQGGPYLQGVLPGHFSYSGTFHGVQSQEVTGDLQPWTVTTGPSVMWKTPTSATFYFSATLYDYSGTRDVTTASGTRFLLQQYRTGYGWTNYTFYSGVLSATAIPYTSYYSNLTPYATNTLVDSYYTPPTGTQYGDISVYNILVKYSDTGTLY